MKHLCIFNDNIDHSKELENTNPSIPSNLKSLSIHIHYYDNFIQFLNRSFLDLTDLFVDLSFICLNQLLLFINKLPNMQLLKKLRLSFKLKLHKLDEASDYVVDHHLTSNVIKFPRLDSLENVELESKPTTSTCVKIDLSQFKLVVEECHKLKYIKFESEDNLKFFGEIGSKKLGLNDNWKLISTPRRYLLHK